MKTQRNIKLFSVILLALCGFISTEATAKKLDWTLGQTPDKSINFYTPPNGKPLALDIFFPENHDLSKKHSCIVFFFGGGWTGGDTKQFHGYSKYFASRGIVAISAQYRTNKSHQTTPRECVEDGKEAIRYIREHAKELGIDPDKIIAGGGSAGGHVAAACAMCPKIDSTPKSPTSCIPNALVLLNPVYDNSSKGYGHDRVKEYWKGISPLHNIRKDLPPTIVFLGSKDKHIPVSTADTFQKQMTDAGNQCTTHLFKKAQHGFFHYNKGGRKSFEAVLTKIDAFLVKHKHLSGENTVKAWTANIVDKSEKKK